MKILDFKNLPTDPEELRDSYPWVYRDCGNEILEVLEKSSTARSINCSNFPANKNEDGYKNCAWCVVNKTKSKHLLARYCSEDCANSLYAASSPQKESGLIFHLFKQQLRCNICNFDYAPTLIEIIKKKPILNPWYMAKRLKNTIDKNRKPEVDHIIPVALGGPTIGISNHQILCFGCHREKSKSDMAAISKMKREKKKQLKELENGNK